MGEQPIDVKPKEEVTPPEPSTPQEPKEPASSPEVKPEPVVEPVKDEDKVAKQQEQIDNLNIALKQQRESKQSDTDKIKQLEDKLTESSTVMDKLQSAFAPEPPPEEQPQGNFMTKEEAESFWQQKETEREAKTQEQEKVQQFQKEIGELEKEWDGVEGKPKYDDQDVLQWQRDSSKIHLSPKEAFNEKHNADIIDWQVKQRLAGKPTTQNVETPAATPQTHEPNETPSSEIDTRKAVQELMDNADKEV